MEPLILRFPRKEYDLSRRTLIMGALNVTPDSFSDGGRFFDPTKAVEQGISLAAGGADILDIGGESTRPGARVLEEEEEIRRVVPVIRTLRDRIEIPISVDTRKSGVARAALDAGAEMVNDVTALRFDARMAELVRERRVPVVLMHMQGRPENMQANPVYGDLVGEILEFLRERIAFAESSGIAPDQIVIDPGLGFGKSPEQSLELLVHLGELRSLGFPVVVGASRKSFLGWALGGAGPMDRLEAGLAAAVLAAERGAALVRTHDVGPTVRSLALLEKLESRRGPRRPPEVPAPEPDRTP